MKRILYLLILSVLFISCGDFLDVIPEKNPSEGSFFQTDKDADDALSKIYHIFSYESTWGRDLFWEQAGGGDDFIYGRSRGEDHNNLANFTYTGRESPLRTSWNQLNEFMANCNWIIYNLLKKSELSQVESNRLGEAYFMRGFLHFHIAYRYGRADQGVPFEKYEEYDLYEYKIPPQQTTVMENYRLIMEDLEKAAGLLPFFEEYSTADYGRPHKAAAWGYMVKVYAYWAQHDESKWALVPPLVNRLENEANRGLLDNYADVFTIAQNWSREHIWSVNSTAANYAGSIFPGVVLENKGWGRYNGWGYYKPTISLYNEYAPDDVRRKVTILEYNDEFVFYGETRRFYSTSDLDAGFMLAKYMEPFTYGTVSEGVGLSDFVSTNGDRPTTDLNLPLIRHAEMVLFKAEALIMTGNGTEAAAQLNRLTSRAGLGNVYTNATLDDLKHERRCELAGEFTDRFMDLKRWKDYHKLGQPKMGRKHENRSDPASPWNEIEVWPAVDFNPATDIVFPYNPDEVVKANGKLRQNPIG